MALYYFLFAALFLAFSLCLYFLVNRQVFYQHYACSSATEEKTGEEGGQVVEVLWPVLTATWPLCTAMVLVFLVTLSVYPTLPILFEPATTDQGLAEPITLSIE